MGAWTNIASAVQEAWSDVEVVRFDGQNSGSVVLRCPWDERHNVAAQLLGLATRWGYVDIGALCAELEIRPAPNSAYRTDPSAPDLLQYEEALVHVKYSVAQVGNLDTATAPDGGEVLYTENLEPTIEYQELDHHQFKWGSSPKRALTEHEAPSRVRRGMNLVRSVFNQPAISATALSLMGNTNDKAYTSAVLGITFDPETLLWIPPSTNRTVIRSGPFTATSKGWNFVFKWGVKEHGWNKFWRTDKAGGADYDSITDNQGNPYKNFPPADMSAFLF